MALAVLGLLIGFAPVWALHWYDYSGRLGSLPVFVADRLCFVGACLIVAFSLALVVDRGIRQGQEIPGWVAACFFALVAGMVLHFGHRLFDSLDGGFIVDLAWRIQQGQKPAVDFPSTTPPFFNEFCHLAWWMFPSTWSGLVKAWSLWGLVLLVGIHALLGSAGSWTALLGSGIVAGGCVLLHAYPFYNPMGWGFFCAGLAAGWAPRSDPFSWFRSITLGVICGLGFFQKPNLWPAWALLLLALAPRDGRKFVGSLAATAVTAALFAWQAGVPIPEYLESLRAVSGTRGSLLSSPVILHPPRLDLLLWAAVSASLGWGWWSQVSGKFSESMGVTIWAAASWIGGSLGFFLNAEMRLCDLTPPAFAAALLLQQAPTSAGFRRGRLTGLALALFFFLSGALLGWQRVRVPASASFTFNPRESLMEISSGVLAGTRVQKDIRLMWEDLRQWNHLRGQEGLFLGPTVEWAYPDFQVAPPVHLPVNWAVGTMVWDMAAARTIWTNKRFPWLILHRERPLPPEISAQVKKDYVIDSKGEVLNLYRRIP